LELPDGVIEWLQTAPEDHVRKVISGALAIQHLAERRTEAGLRKWIAVWLGVSSATVLGVSLFLLVGQAFGVVSLPEQTLSALALSIAGEFVGMFYFVVRYLFPGRKPL
jgi:hypothetical protein